MKTRRIGNRGLLAGTVRKLDDIAPDDKRRMQPRFQPGHLERNLELLKPVEKIAADHGATTAQVALAWLFAQGADIIPIPGARQQKYLEQNVVALDLQLTQPELDLLALTFKPGARAGDRYNPGYFEMLGVQTQRCATMRAARRTARTGMDLNIWST